MTLEGVRQCRGVALCKASRSAYTANEQKFSLRSQSRAADVGLLKKVLVPFDRVQQSFVERVARRPSEESSSLLGAQELFPDFGRSLAANLRFKIRSHQSHNPRHDIEHCRPFFVREVERLAAQLRAHGKRLGEQKVCGGRVFDVKVVANE